MCPSVTGPSVPLGENGPIECHTTSDGLFVHFASVKRGSGLFQWNIFCNFVCEMYFEEARFENFKQMIVMGCVCNETLYEYLNEEI